ncbi:MAG: histidine kinase [Gallionellaceae bacterium]|nr:histidine kinase [Gallionellaceae bacterium]
MTDISPKPLRLDNFIANLPCMAFQLVLARDNTFSFSYIGDGSQALLGIAPDALAADINLFLKLVHAEDSPSFIESMCASAQNLSFWSWEGRVILANGELKWLTLGSSPQTREDGKVEWEGLVVNVTQTKLDELELLRSQQQLREFSSHIQDAKEQERLRIAREVHDEIGGLLTAIKMDLAWMKERLPKTKKVLTDKATTIENLVDKAMTAARNLAHSLRPGYLDSFGIVAAIEMEACEFEQRTGIKCLLTHNDEEMELDLHPDVSIAIFRIFQESLTNIMKHAQATEVRILIQNSPQNIELTISDNGKGFSHDARMKPRSFGLRGIQERVAHFGGEVSFTSAPGQGTTVSVTVPHIPVDSAPSDTLPQQPLF